MSTNDRRVDRRAISWGLTRARGTLKRFFFVARRSGNTSSAIPGRGLVRAQNIRTRSQFSEGGCSS